MSSLDYEVILEPSAERDLRQQVDWLILNRGLQQAVAFRNALDSLFQQLSRQPFLWPKRHHFGRPVRKAVMDKRTIVF